MVRGSFITSSKAPRSCLSPGSLRLVYTQRGPMAASFSSVPPELRLC